MRRFLAGFLTMLLILAVPASALAAATAKEASAAKVTSRASAAKVTSRASAAKVTSRASAAKVTSTPGSAGAPSQSQLTPPNSASPLSPGLPQTPASTPTSTSPAIVAPGATTKTASHDSGLSGAGIILIVIGALIVVVGVSWYIWHDARRHTRRRHVAGAKVPQPRPSVPGSKRPPKARKLSPAEKRRRKRGRAR